LPSTRTARTSESRSSLRRVSAALLAGALWLLASSAQAAGPAPLVVVVSSSPDAPFVRRLAAELSLFGYRVEVEERAVGEGELDQVLARSGGSALIAVDQGKQTAEVIVAERGPAGGTRREMERLDPRRRADTNAAVLAERFRARLTELGIAPIAEESAPAAPLAAPLPERPAPEPERRLWLAASLGISSGGLGLQPDAGLELRAFPVRWLSTSAFGKLSLADSRVTADEGSADVGVVAGGLLIDVYPLRGDLSAHVGAGALLVNAAMAGRAEPPWQGQKVSVLVPGAILEGGAALRITPRVSAELRGFVGACSPRIAVRIAERKAADYGQPLFGASLGVAVGVF
jgi:hypothetical protein